MVGEREMQRIAQGTHALLILWKHLLLSYAEATEICQLAKLEFKL